MAKVNLVTMPVFDHRQSEIRQEAHAVTNLRVNVIQKPRTSRHGPEKASLISGNQDAILEYFIYALRAWFACPF